VHWLDSAYLALTSRVQLFSRGWGEHEAVMESAAPLRAPHEPARLKLSWSAADGPVSIGTAVSPCPRLMAPVSTVTVLRLTPPNPRARVVLPPSWGDEGFTKRRFGFGGLLARGVELWMLEGAYFGTRRIRARLAMSTVEEFLTLGLATVLELRALVAAARADGRPVAVAGYSMAGQLAAQAVATLPWEIPIVAMAPSDSAGPVFIDGPLSKAVDFAALGDDARERLGQLFHRSRVQALPPPRSKRRTVVATRRDGIVPPTAMERLAAHWDVTPRWLDTGHLGAYLFHRDVLQRAVLEALDL
jgi:hypothetical protein